MLSYCPVKSRYEMDCIEDKTSIIFNDTTLLKYSLTELKPYTHYRVGLYMISKSGKHGSTVETIHSTKEEGK